jgi:hypothetical protein
MTNAEVVPALLICLPPTTSGCRKRSALDYFWAWPMMTAKSSDRF